MDYFALLGIFAVFQGIELFCEQVADLLGSAGHILTGVRLIRAVAPAEFQGEVALAAVGAVDRAFLSQAALDGAAFHGEAGILSCGGDQHHIAALNSRKTAPILHRSGLFYVYFRYFSSNWGSFV